MRLLAVLINFRTAEMTADALRSLVGELGKIPNSCIIVVDNGSDDGSCEVLARTIRDEGWSELASLVVSERNRGFAGGINHALRPALAGADPPEFVYLLNSDAFVEPGAVGVLLAFLERNPGVGICGSYIHGLDGVAHDTAFRFPTILGELIARVPLWPLTPLLRRYAVAMPIPSQPQRVDWLAGASMMIRRAVFESIGLFDERFFLYYEETDFCLRAHGAGFPTWYVPESRVAHVGSASTGIQDPSRPRAGYWFESRRRYLRKHHGLPYLWLANLVWLVGFGAARLRRRVTGLGEADPPGLLRDFLRHNFLARRPISSTVDGAPPADNA